ncbi:MAG: polysaccharide biosynthesis/export family protein [Campylobacterota bacterium]|nr:polysaccharide biosynthesis/export family protein [Campylobacterota bacterium]
MFVFFKFCIYILFSLFMFGCATAPENINISSTPVKVLKKSVNKASAVVDRSTMILKEKKRKELIEQSCDGYKIKTGDRIIVSVTGHPELSTSVSPSLSSKSFVNQNGTIQLPTIGIIYVAGKTTLEVKKDITKKLKKILFNPNVTVNSAFIRKYRYNLIGNFVNTETIEKDYKMTLLEVISYGKGIKKETADLRHAYVIRNKRKLPVNLYRLLEKGDISQNIDMRDRDTVVVPSYQRDQFVYLFSKLSRAGKAQIPLIDGKLTLIQALSMSEVIEVKESQMDFNNIYVIRTEMDRVETFKIDAQKMFEGDILPFNLLGGDVVYIPKTKVGGINEVVSYFFPTLQLIYNILNNIQAYRTVRDYAIIEDE